MSHPPVGELLPDITLTSVTGQRIRLSDYRGRRALILLFLGRERDATAVALLSALAERYAEFLQEEAEVLAIIPGPHEAVATIARAHSWPFPILVDEDERAHRKYGAAARGILYIADRYGEIVFISPIAEEHVPLSVESLLSWIRFTEAQCPECGVAEWPASLSALRG